MSRPQSILGSVSSRPKDGAGRARESHTSTEETIDDTGKWSKDEKVGCGGFLAFGTLAVVMGIFAMCGESAEERDPRLEAEAAPVEEWFEGGTLHRSNGRQWRQSSTSDRLATSAAFAMVLLKDHPIWEGQSPTWNEAEMEALRPHAEELQECIDVATEGGGYDHRAVSEVAAVCGTMMWFADSDPSEARQPPSTARDSVTSRRGFSDGTHLIGKDIQPGLYHTRSLGCYWERLSGLSGSLDDILANENTSGPSYVEISPTDYAFKSVSCGTWELVD